GGGQDAAYVELPRRAPNSARQREFERSDRTAGADDAHEFPQRCGWVSDIPQEVRERQRVERMIGEGQSLGARLDETYAGAEPASRFREHLCALIHADDGATLLANQLPHN